MTKKMKSLLKAQVAAGVISEDICNAGCEICEALQAIENCNNRHATITADTNDDLQAFDTDTQLADEWITTEASEYILECLDDLLNIRNAKLDAIKDEYSGNKISDLRDMFDIRQARIKSIKDGSVKDNAESILAVNNAIETAFATATGAYFLIHLIQQQHAKSKMCNAAMMAVEAACGLKVDKILHNGLYRESLITADLASNALDILNGVMAKIENPPAELIAEYNRLINDDSDAEITDEAIAAEEIAGRQYALDEAVRLIAAAEQRIVELKAQCDAILNCK